MQGRLLPKFRGRYQAHPLGYWQDEFLIARDIGLDCIEFILDFNDAEKNPLLYEAGVEEVISLSKKTGVHVKTICADYFMEAPLHSNDRLIANESLDILRRLISTSIKLDATDIVIPCVDHSSFNNGEDINRFVSQINKVLLELDKNNINLSLETDLAPQPFVEFLNKIDSNHIKVNYDIGNSASLGYDLEEELNAYGERISDIHIKDRLPNGGPVPLGQGNANFELFFNKIKEFNYKGPFVMQAYRDDEGLALFKKQLSWIKPYLRML